MQLLDVPFSPNKDKTGYYIKAADGTELVCVHVCCVCVCASVVLFSIASLKVIYVQHPTLLLFYFQLNSGMW